MRTLVTDLPPQLYCMGILEVRLKQVSAGYLGQSDARMQHGYVVSDARREDWFGLAKDRLAREGYDWPHF